MNKNNDTFSNIDMYKFDNKQINRFNKVSFLKVSGKSEFVQS